MYKMLPFNSNTKLILLVAFCMFYEINCSQSLHKKKTNLNTSLKNITTTSLPIPNTTENNSPEENVDITNSENEMLVERPKINMLDIISSMGKAIHILLNQRDQMLKQSSDNHESATREDHNSTTTTTHEPINIFRPLKINGKVPPEGFSKDYAAQANALRQQIVRRCNQLQNIISTTNEILRERENYMFAKILDNFSGRIEQTKIRADLILKEPSTSEMAVKALNRINFGLNNINHLVQNVLSRVNVSINLDMNQSQTNSLNKNKKETRKDAKKDIKATGTTKKTGSNMWQAQEDDFKSN